MTIEGLRTSKYCTMRSSSTVLHITTHRKVVKLFIQSKRKFLEHEEFRIKLYCRKKIQTESRIIDREWRMENGEWSRP